MARTPQVTCTYTSGFDLTINFVRIALPVSELLREVLDLILPALVLLDDAWVRLETHLQPLALSLKFVVEVRDIAIGCSSFLCDNEFGLKQDQSDQRTSSIFLNVSRTLSGDSSSFSLLRLSFSFESSFAF